jgi:hypothetical protein
VGCGGRDRPEAAARPIVAPPPAKPAALNPVQKLLTNRDLNDLNAEADLAIAAAINEMVEAATSADAKSAASMKTSPDDDDEDWGWSARQVGVMAR